MSSVITLGMGQCGVQVAQSLMDSLSGSDGGADGGSAKLPRAFFRESPCGKTYARTALIDMEPKVVSSAVSRRSSRGYQFDAKSTFAKEGGSGNNWAYGYHEHGPCCVDQLRETIRREVERSDLLGGFLVLQSTAGGTGSGVGTYVTKLLRDEYPVATILNHCIWPHTSGEVNVQSYNTTLTLSHLVEDSDGVLLVPNTVLSDMCERCLRIKRPSFEDMNGVAAEALAGILLPAGGRQAEPGTTLCKTSSTRLLRGIASHLCAHPCFKLLSLRHVPQMHSSSVNFTTYTWPGLLRSLELVQRSGSFVDSSGGGSAARTTSPAIASLLVLRGRDSISADARRFMDPNLYCRWASSPLKVEASQRQCSLHEMTASLLSNSGCTVPYITDALLRTYKMHGSGAYLHRYSQHGLGDCDWNHAFARLEDLVDAYSAL